MIRSDRAQDQRDGSAGHRHSVAEFSHQRLGGVSERFQARQSKKAAGALDGVNEPENVIEDFCVVRILLETNELVVDGIETLIGLGQKLTQQIVHEAKPSRKRGARCTPPRIRSVSAQSV